jgi:hypothetical protein
MVDKSITRYFKQRNELDTDVINGRLDPDVIRSYLQAIIYGASPWRNANLWSPVCTYVPKIKARSDLRGWGLTDEQLFELALNLEDHAGPLQPEGISLTLGKGLEYDLAEAEAWAKDSFTALGMGISFTDYVQKKASPVEYYGTKHTFVPAQPTIAPAHLDLEKFWDKVDGVSVSQVRDLLTNLPTTEPYWLKCLNPKAWLSIDGKTMPLLTSPGLVVNDDDVQLFRCDKRTVHVGYYWSQGQWGDLAVVTFRK